MIKISVILLLFFQLMIGGDYSYLLKDSIADSLGSYSLNKTTINYQARKLYKDSITLFNRSKSTVDFAYYDKFDDRIVFSLLAGQVFRIYTDAPVFLIQTNINQNFYLLKLNEEVSVNLDRQGNAILNIQNSAIRNNELNFSRIMNEKLPSFNFITINQQIQRFQKENILKIDSLLELEFKTKYRFLQKYKTLNPISRSFEDYVTAFFRSHLLGSKLYFIGITQKNIPGNYINYLLSLKKEIIDAPEYEDNIWTRKMQFNFIKFLNRDNIKKEYYKDSLYKLTKALLHDDARFDILFYIAKTELTENHQSDKWFIKDFMDNNHFNFYNEYINDLLERNSMMNRSGKNYMLINLKKQKLDYDTVLNSSKNKIIYIDVWASWCLPCRREMLVEKKLMSKYQGKPINFVYISIDDDFSAWETVCMNQGLNIFENNYWMPNFSGSTFKEIFKISTIPLYILIDKKGKVISAEAPRPSDPEITSLFDKYLKQ